MDFTLLSDHAGTVDQDLSAIDPAGFFFDDAITNRRVFPICQSDYLFRISLLLSFSDCSANKGKFPNLRCLRVS